MQQYMSFTQDIAKAGKLRAGAPLEPTGTATTVRVRNDKTLTTDGPFAETRTRAGTISSRPGILRAARHLGRPQHRDQTQAQDHQRAGTAV